MILLIQSYALYNIPDSMKKFIWFRTWVVVVYKGNYIKSAFQLLPVSLADFNQLGFMSHEK